jgi:hypothetical protein
VGLGEVEVKAPNKANGADGRFKAFMPRFGFYWESVAAAHWQALERSLKTSLSSNLNEIIAPCHLKNPFLPTIGRR